MWGKFKMDYFKHKTAIIEKGAKIGKDTKIWHFAHVRENAEIGENCNFGKDVYIDKNAKIGNNVKIQNSVSIWNGIIIENDVFIGPNACFINDLYPRSKLWNEKRLKKTLIKEGASIGANATILCNLEIGKYALVGAGSVVTKNVPNYGIVVGNPAKLIGYACTCGNKLKPTKKNNIMVCNSCKKEIDINL